MGSKFSFFEKVVQDGRIKEAMGQHIEESDQMKQKKQTKKTRIIFGVEEEKDQGMWIFQMCSS